MNKKTLIIIGAITGLIIIGLLVFYFLKPPEPGEEPDKGIFSFLFPTGPDKPLPSPTTPSEPGLLPGETQIYGYPGKGLFQLTQIAVSGSVFNEETKKLQYFEKSTGHVYEISPDGTDKKQLTITTIPKIFKASWSNDTTKAILRYFDTENENIEEQIQTFLAHSIATSTSSIDGSFLPSNTLSAVISPTEDKIFYLLKNQNETQGITASFENKNQKEIFSSPFSEFLTGWPQKNIITLLTKPSFITEGYFYKLNPSTKSFTKIIGNIKGLTAIYSAIDDKILYSQSENKTISTNVYDSDKKATQSLGLKTLPEKCLFSAINTDIIYCAIPRNIPKSDYPDDWYQGLFFFSDTLWQINLSSGAKKMILDEEDFDIINIFSDEKENYLFFQDKRNSTLWSFKLI